MYKDSSKSLVKGQSSNLLYFFFVYGLLQRLTIFLKWQWWWHLRKTIQLFRLVCSCRAGPVSLAWWQDIFPPGALNFFSGMGCAARISEVWGLRTDICLWKGGLVSGKFPNLGACELKISKFGGLWAKIWVKIEAAEAKISKFSQKGVLWTDSFAWNGTLASGRRGVKRGSSGPHIPIPSF